jgi:hypothetical protein
MLSRASSLVYGRSGVGTPPSIMPRIVSVRMPGSLSAATSPQLEAPDRWALMLRYHGLAEQAEEPRPCTAILGAAQVPAGSEPAETVVLTGAAPNANTRAGRLASDHGRLRLMIA